jgi:hypothetical protein
MQGDTVIESIKASAAPSKAMQLQPAARQDSTQQQSAPLQAEHEEPSKGDSPEQQPQSTSIAQPGAVQQPTSTSATVDDHVAQPAQQPVMAVASPPQPVQAAEPSDTLQVPQPVSEPTAHMAPILRDAAQPQPAPNTEAIVLQPVPQQAGVTHTGHQLAPKVADAAAPQPAPQQDTNSQAIEPPES